VCNRIEDCPGAYEELLAGKTPVGCGFLGFEPIICCPRNRVTPTPTPQSPIEQIDEVRPLNGWKFNKSRGAVARKGK